MWRGRRGGRKEDVCRCELHERGFEKMCFKRRSKAGGGFRVTDFRGQGIPMMRTLVREAAVAKRLSSERRDSEGTCIRGGAKGSCGSVCVYEI